MSTPTRPAAAAAVGVPDPDAVDAVAVLMTEVSEGRLTADTMADRAAARVREVFGQCDGPADPLWPVHVDLCRQVLGHGGLPAAELAQWLSVARSRENPSRPGDYPLAPGETGSGELSAQYGGADAEAEAEAKPVARQADTVDAMDAVDDDDETIEVPDELADQIKALIAQHHREHPRPREDDNQ